MWPNTSLPRRFFFLRDTNSFRCRDSGATRDGYERHCGTNIRLRLQYITNEYNRAAQTIQSAWFNFKSK